MEGIKEKLLKDYPGPIFIKGTKIILNQMKKGICRICKKDGTKGTGFFCKIPRLDGIYSVFDEEKEISVLITNNHIINEKDLDKEDDILIKMNNGKENKLISISLKNTFTYTSEKYDITIIKIKNEDKIFDFLRIR